ncbi:MAG: response regulator [Synechococcaceae cyanobacterium]|jgi:DNA-binding response OmpR family regulator
MRSSTVQPAAGSSVAVVDDDPRLRTLLAMELEDLGVAASCFSSAIDLLTWEHLHELKLILLDLVMPEMDGLTCLLKLRQNCFRGMVVIVTANWESSRERDLLDAGADDCWIKTVALERLGPLVQQLGLAGLQG